VFGAVAIWLLVTADSSSAEASLTVAFLGAYWAALFEFRRALRQRGGRPADAPRMVAGLILAAACSHVGSLALHWTAIDDPERLLAAASGFCSLFLPLGIWLSAAAMAERPRRAYLAAAMASLPIALGTARLGCLAAGCCGGTETRWGAHPTQVYELIGCLALAAIVGELSSRRVAPAVVAGLGIIRLAVEPWRAPPALGAPVVPVSLLASALLVSGLYGLLAPRSGASAR
jgi:hypothetical protein